MQQIQISKDRFLQFRRVQTSGRRLGNHLCMSQTDVGTELQLHGHSRLNSHL